MSKQKLFDDDSEEEVAIKTENVYAKKYDTWREKEEIHKLEQKYGAKALNSDASISSDSEDESDEPPEISEEVEEQFLKTLALLKTKDPRIYDPDYKFFEEMQKEEVKEEKKKTLTFADSDEEENEDGNIFSIEKKAEIIDEKATPREGVGSSSKVGKDGKIKDYLTGKVEHINDPVEKDLAPLKALWSDPKLNEGEVFLRDYILNKRYLDEGDAGEAEDKLRDDDDLEADEKMVEEQGKFERAYNFRFEEPDQEYLKRFPRTMNSIRPKDDKRSRKRVEVRDRKEEEKRRKMEEIARLKALKLKEIQEKIARIKEVTGNEELAFKDADIEGDFDPAEHDKRMKAIFDEEYYGEADDEKPVFPDLDEELEIENWDNYNPENADEDQDSVAAAGPHCEDAEFNMDADYDPKRARANLLEEIQSTLGKKRRNRKKKSKLAKLLTGEKPTFLPTEEKTYDQHMEEYYQMDCEDVVGGMPTRFKYREVVPNDYGLTVEEILLADDKELTQWVPLKRLVRLRPESVQKGEVSAYRQKAADVALKRKVLPSLFKDLPEEPELVVPKETKKKKKKNRNKKAEDTAADAEDNEDKNKGESSINDASEQNSEEGKSKKKKKAKNKDVENETATAEENALSNPDNETVDSTAKRKKKNKNIHIEDTVNPEESTKPESCNTDDTELKPEHNGDVTKGKKKKMKGFKVENVLNVTPSQESTAPAHLKRKVDDGAQDSQIPNKKKKNKNNAKNNVQVKKNKDFKKNLNSKNKQNKDNPSDNPLSKLSDERLKAYGLNPKKYRSFLKYKKF